MTTNSIHPCNRVAKTVGGVTTAYLVDTLNHTGHAQVVEELQGGSVVRQYTYGHDLVSQLQLIAGEWKASFYGYDGHGSVRYLTDEAHGVTDAHIYDTFGTLVSRHVRHLLKARAAEAHHTAQRHIHRPPL